MVRSAAPIAASVLCKPMDAAARGRGWHLVFAQYQEALDELPNLLDDPERYVAKWREIERCAAKLEELMPTTTDPLPPYPTG